MQTWEDLDPYAFPLVAILGKVLQNLQNYLCRRIILIAPGWPNMPWFWDLVIMLGQIPLCLLNLLTQPPIQPDPSQEPHKSESSCLAPEALQRVSTKSVYEAKCTIFTKWCHSNQVDFRALPIKSIDDFLLYLLQARKLQPSTIDGDRSSIADKLGNLPIYVSKDENLTHFWVPQVKP